MTRTVAVRYTAVAQILHWLIAALIVLQFTLAYMAADLPLGMRKLGLLARHKSFGMTILALAVVRLWWRAYHKAPPLPSAISIYVRIGAHLSHWGLYTLLFLMPLSGWLMSSAKNYSVSWFGLFTWPNLIPANEPTFDFLKVSHDTMSEVLLCLACLHILAALKHHFWNKDEVLRRMLPGARLQRRP